VRPRSLGDGTDKSTERLGRRQLLVIHVTVNSVITGVIVDRPLAIIVTFLTISAKLETAPNSRPPNLGPVRTNHNASSIPKRRARGHGSSEAGG